MSKEIGQMICKIETADFTWVQRMRKTKKIKNIYLLYQETVQVLLWHLMLRT
jgi:hypothetical protein